MVWRPNLPSPKRYSYLGTMFDKQQRLVLSFSIPLLLLLLTVLMLVGVSGYLVAFIAAIFSLWLCYLVVAIRAETQYQINTLSNLIEAMIQGDYNMRSRLNDSQGLNDISMLLNQLADTLLNQKMAAKESRLLLERMLEQMDAMVLITNEQGYVVMSNQYARQVFNFDAVKQTQIHLPSDVKGKQVTECSDEILNFGKAGQAGQYFLFKDSFLNQGKQHQLYIIRDANRLLMEKERKAWQGLLRVLSHELNNSLTPIIGISQQLQKKLAHEDKITDSSQWQAGIGIISERASSLSSFINSYGELTHLPPPQKSMHCLKTMIEDTAVLYPNLRVSLAIDESLAIHVDKKQFEQVLVNIFKNAQEAMLNQPVPSLQIAAKVEQQNIVLQIQDTGIGISNPDNLFVPFYSTKPQGSGIGLALCRQILFNHNASITLSNNPQGIGACTTIIFNGQGN